MKVKIGHIDQGNKTVFGVSILDWLTATAAQGDFIVLDGATEATFTFALPQGFEISGTCAYQPEPQLRFSGIATGITVTDPSLYPGNVEQVFFDFKFY